MNYPDLIFDSEVRDFISTHLQDSVSNLALKSHRNSSIPMAFLLDQIKARQKAISKIPFFAQNPFVVFPSGVPIEQCSSESTALYKANLASGSTFLDLTGGLGIDVWAFSGKFEKLFHLEQNEEIHLCAQHNFKQLELASKIETVYTDSISWLKNTTLTFDCIYYDPARRAEGNKKVFLFQDCSPNALEIQELLFSKTNLVITKVSPLVDVRYVLDTLPFVKEIHIISVKNDCKELLIVQEKNFTGETHIHCVNLETSQSDFSFFYSEEENSCSNYDDTLTGYLYEPNTSVLKAGAFNTISEEFQLNKVAPNSHLYFSEQILNSFPGRSFKIQGVCGYQLKELITILPSLQASVSTRNFISKPDEIKKKFKLKESDHTQLFATRNLKNKPLLIISTKILS